MNTMFKNKRSSSRSRVPLAVPSIALVIHVLMATIENTIPVLATPVEPDIPMPPLAEDAEDPELPEVPGSYAGACSRACAYVSAAACLACLMLIVDKDCQMTSCLGDSSNVHAAPPSQHSCRGWSRQR